MLTRIAVLSMLCIAVLTEISMCEQLEAGKTERGQIQEDITLRDTRIEEVRHAALPFACVKHVSSRQASNSIVC